MTNKITNSSFESDTPGNGNTPSTWTAYGDSATYKGVANDFASDGVNSYKISNTALMDGGIYIQLSGMDLRSPAVLSAYVKTDSDVTNATITLDTVQNGAGGSTTVTKNISGVVDGRLSITLRSLDSTLLNVYLGLGSFGSTSKGTVWFDDIRLVSEVGHRPVFFHI